MNGWKSIRESTPDRGTEVWVFCDDYGPIVTPHLYEGSFPSLITHWHEKTAMPPEYWPHEYNIHAAKIGKPVMVELDHLTTVSYSSGHCVITRRQRCKHALNDVQLRLIQKAGESSSEP